MVAITALNVIFWVDVLDYMKHVDSNGVVDPAYESPTTIAVVITFFITIVALICFITDLIFYFNVKKRMKNKNNNIEISVKSDDQKLNTALDTAQAKFMTAGLVADLNKQTEIDAEYAYKMELTVKTKETAPLFLYILYKPFGLTLLILLAMCTGLNLLFNMSDLKQAIVPIIISCSVSILFFVGFFIFLVVRANKSKKKAIQTTKEMGFRIYSDHIEQYNILLKDDSEVEIRYKVPFLKMKYLETKRAFYFRGYNNGQVVALRLDKKEMPEEAYILIKAKLNK